MSSKKYSPSRVLKEFYNVKSKHVVHAIKQLHGEGTVRLQNIETLAGDIFPLIPIVHYTHYSQNRVVKGKKSLIALGVRYHG